MEGYLQLFDKLIENKNATQSMEKQLVSLIETLFEDLATSQNTITTLQTQLKMLADSKKLGATSKYWSLKKAHESLKEENQVLKQEVTTMARAWILKEEELKKQHLANLQEIEAKYQGELEQLKSTIQSLEDNKKELLTQLYCSDSMAPLQTDEFNSKLKQQLDETMEKLQDTMNTSNILRGELRRVKEQFASYQLTSTEKIVELKRKLEKVTTGRHQQVSPASKYYSLIERELFMNNSAATPFGENVCSSTKRVLYPTLIKSTTKDSYFDYINEHDNEAGDKNDKPDKKRLGDYEDLASSGLEIN